MDYTKHNKKYEAVYKLGNDYEIYFFKLLKYIFKNDKLIKIVNTKLYDYNDFLIYKNDKLILTLEIKYRTNTNKFNTLLCNLYKYLSYLEDDAVNKSKNNNCFAGFLLLYNCADEDLYYIQDVDKLNWNNKLKDGYLNKSLFNNYSNVEDVLQFIKFKCDNVVC